MSVAVVDTGTVVYNTSAATQNYTFTVSAGATIALFYIIQDATQTITSVTWDQGGTNQACTLVGSEPCFTASNGHAYIYAVVNPTVGAAKQLRVVQAVAAGLSCEMQSYSGTISSSVAAACTNVLVAKAPNATDAAGNKGTAAQSGASGDMYVSCWAGNAALATTPVNGTAIYFIAPAGLDASGSRLLSTGASVALLWATTGSGDWAVVSCDIVAAAAAAPIAVTDRLPSQRIRASAVDASVALNPNLFKNPVPTFNGDQSSSRNIPRFLPYPQDGLNINLFKNPFPFNTYDFPEAKDIPGIPWKDIAYNPNLQTNPVPFDQYHFPLASRVPQARTDPQIGINPNLFTNPVPFLNQFVPVHQPPWTWPGDQALNINLFTNPFPIGNVLGAPSAPLAGAKSVDAAYNQNLYTVTVVAAPFIPIDFQKPSPLRGAPPTPQGLNPNLFTNPVPIFNGDQSPGSSKLNPDWAPTPPPPLNVNLFTNPVPVLNLTPPPAPAVLAKPLDAVYNPNLYTVVVAATPFLNQLGPAKAAAPAPLFEQPYNVNLYLPTITSVVSNQFPPGFVLPPATPWAAPYNPNLFSTPAVALPFNNYWLAPPRAVPSAPYDLNNTVVFIFDTPLNQYDSLNLKPFWPAPYRPTPDGLNPNLFPPVAATLPFNQTFWPPTSAVPLAPLSFDNTVVFFVDFPFNTYDYPRASRTPQAPRDLSFPFNPNLPPAAAGTTLIQRTLTGVGL